MGDWVVSRAAADAGSANWLAIEMRRNRVRMTWAKGVRARLDNLAVLRGMAHEMLSRVPEDSLSESTPTTPTRRSGWGARSAWWTRRFCSKRTARWRGAEAS